jgi:integrase
VGSGGLEPGGITLKKADTKTKQGREVPMTPDLLATFRDLTKVRHLRQERVFVSHKGEGIKSFRTAWLGAIERAGIKNIRFHDLRHCAITNFRRAGVDLKTTMSISGHKSMRSWARYNSVEEQDLKDAAVKLNTLITRQQSEAEGGLANSASA